MTQPYVPRRIRRAGAAAVLTLLAASCTGSSTGEQAAVGSAPAPEAAASAGTPEPAQVGAPEPAQVGTPLAPRRVQRAEVTVSVPDLTAAARQVRAVAAGLLGTVTEESIGLRETADPGSYGGGDVGLAPVGLQPAGPGQARLVLRVPPEQLSVAMDRVALLGDELSRWQGSTDMELTLVDLDSRIATQTASVARVRALMDGATSLSDVVTIEAELTSRTQELESLTAQQQSLEGQVQLATLTAVLQVPSVTAQQQDDTGFLGGLRRGWDAFTSAGGGLLTVAGAALPFVLLGVLVGWPALLLARRARRRRGGEAPGTGAGGGHAEVGAGSGVVSGVL